MTMFHFCSLKNRQKNSNNESVFMQSLVPMKAHSYVVLYPPSSKKYSLLLPTPFATFLMKYLNSGTENIS